MSPEERSEKLTRLRDLVNAYVAQKRARLLAEKQFLDSVLTRGLGGALSRATTQENAILKTRAKALLGLDNTR